MFFQHFDISTAHVPLFGAHQSVCQLSGNLCSGYQLENDNIFGFTMVVFHWKAAIVSLPLPLFGAHQFLPTLWIPVGRCQYLFPNGGFPLEDYHFWLAIANLSVSHYIDCQVAFILSATTVRCPLWFPSETKPTHRKPQKINRFFLDLVVALTCRWSTSNHLPQEK